MVEKTVSDEIDSLFSIRHAFGVLEWAPVLNFEGNYYPRVVCEFYANIENKEDAGVSRVLSFVKRCRIELGCVILARILGVRNQGPSVEFVKDTVLSDRQYKLTGALVRLHYSPIRDDRTGDMVFHTCDMLISQHLLVYLYSSNVLSRASSLNEVRCYDIYLLDKMLHGLQGVEEDIAMLGHADMLTEAKLYRMRYVRVREVWRNLVCHPLREGEITDSCTAPVVATDDEEEHSKAPASSAMPFTSVGAPVHLSQGSLVASALQRIENICTSLVARQDVMEAQLQRQDEQLQQIRALLERFSLPHP
ncbi:hypothetical protein FNV43_RR11172 [Rhamnella rubrinervis]|uniref:Uncharacterized protein n=1 Tax=Rhamnella rubrinervis TaxID=2594499 RepID=A0A8K0H5M6_9ROSA|nr:hypothetical protein FNV43_RR11172 [Rhamnella rubrinervis]